MTKSIVKMEFDDHGCGIGEFSDGIQLVDKEGNSIKLSIRAILRCVSILEKTGKIPKIEIGFWNDERVRKLARSMEKKS